MRVLRSRQIVSPQTTPKAQKTRLRKLNIEPSTPSQTKEPSSTLQSSSSLSSSRSPNPDPSSNPGSISTGSGPNSVHVSGSKLRRSLRLASKTAEPEDVEDGRRGFGEVAMEENEEEIDGGVLGMAVNKEKKFTLFGKSIRVFENEGEEGVDGEVVEGLGEHGLASDSGNLGPTSGDLSKGKRKLGIDINFPASECGGEDGGGRREFLNLRSGKKVAKRGIEGVEDLGNFGKDESGREEKGKRKSAEYGGWLNPIEIIELDSEEEAGRSGEPDGGESILEREMVGGSRKGKRKMSSGSEEGGSTIEILKDESISIENGIQQGIKRFSSEEKGKGKLVEGTLVPNSDDKVELELELKLGWGSGLGLRLESEVKPSGANVVSNATSLPDNVASVEGQASNSNTRENNSSRNEYMEHFRRIARANAARFAIFDREEEEHDELPAEVDAEPATEDWCGPFSTAMKIIQDQETRNLRASSSFMVKKKPAQLVWTPKKSQDCERSKSSVPSLLELSLRGLAKNADSIVSLELVPDWLRHRLSQLLCDSRRMNVHVFKLLIQGSPTEVRLRDCSWLTEEEFTKSLQNFDPSKLIVLQLDQCGRCLPDYVLLDTLAQSANNFPALITVSIRGACRLSDVGLKSLVSSAPAIRSLNLNQCSLLTSSSIDTLANSLGSNLRELYLDDCQSIDAMLMLPALTKLEQLEVLSLAGIESVCDEFIREFINIRGHNMKELVLTDCVKLTDSSLRVISETCSGLLAIDLMNLCKLTDSTLLYLANGCQTIQRLKLCRNSFSDKSIAAFLETAGEFLEELSLNNVKKVGYHTALSLGRRSRKLHSLDLSWCRNLTDMELGFIVDSCLSLRVLKLFGCTQITEVFLNGHSNPEVQIIGLKMAPVLEHVWVPNPYAAPLRYSSVPSLF